MAFDPAVGTEGRVRIGGSDHVVAGITEWRIAKTCAVIPINHFELSADADGIVWSTFSQGLASATVTIRGHYNVDATDKTEGGTPAIKVGAAVSIDLFFTRTPFGYTNLAGFVSSLNAGTVIENQTATFDATIQLSGTVAVAA
jgi:hypothetical protein